ncbi:MAG: NifB/NifX family molybdenum-iron cluster-binding protein [Candidatus Eisenbacteria sp.]|nr:NifB/NifX family molybdenum-iron cluster-binding protein [Candidatus Eisenbacteria bacterium]
MTVVIPTFKGRISPVFDVARHLVLVDVEGGKELGRREARFENTGLVERSKRLAELGAHVLICGAISRPLEAILTSAGVWVIPNTCGLVEEVLRAFLSGQLTQQAFLMPGCRGQRRRYRGRHRRGRYRQ